MTVALRLEGVVRGFDTPAGRETALKGVNFAAQTGELVVLVGKSGSGKSVLLHLLAGLDRLTAGSIQVGETLLNDLEDRALTHWRRREVGVLLQDHQLLLALSALQNVQLPMELAGTVRASDQTGLDVLALGKEVFSHLLDQSEPTRERIDTMSRERVAIAANA